MKTYYRILIILSCNMFVTCDTFRGRTVLEKLSILGEDIESMNNKIFRMERSRKTDLRIFEHDINLRIKEMVSDVLSDVILDKVKTGEVSGVVTDGVNSLIERQQQQIHLLKTQVAGVVRDKYPVKTVPRKADNSPAKNKRLFRKVNKIQNQFKELKDEIVHLNLKIIDLEKQLKRRERERREEAVSPTTVPKEYTPVETSKQTPTVQPRATKAKSRRGMTDHSFCQGKSVIMNCRSRGESTDPSWQKDGGMLTYGTRLWFPSGGRISLIHDYTHEWDLEIRALRVTDSGEYACRSKYNILQRHNLTVRECKD